MKTSYYYKAYNLTVETPFPIRELVAIKPQKTDIIIKELPVANSLSQVNTQEGYFEDEMRVQTNDTELLITIKGLVKFYSPDVHTIHIEREAGVSDDDVVLYLLGTCLACLNMLRGVFALHGSAIHTEKGSLLFIGNSGVGKSTTAAKMIAKGYKLQADDVSFIYFDAHNQAWVYPAYPQLKLWDTSVEKLGIEKKGLEFISPLWQKFRIAAHENFLASPTPLMAIYELVPSEHSRIKITPLYRFDKIKILLENTYRNYTIQALGLEKAHFAFCTILATSITVKSVSRPNDAFLIDELTDIIESDFFAAKNV